MGLGTVLCIIASIILPGEYLGFTFGIYSKIPGLIGLHSFTLSLNHLISKDKIPHHYNRKGFFFYSFFYRVLQFDSDFSLFINELTFR